LLLQEEGVRSIAQIMARPRSPSVLLWRPPSAGGLFIAGRTRHYAIEPAGNWVIGAITSGEMRSFSARGEYRFGAGGLCVWTDVDRHSGEATERRGWSARLVIIDPAFTEQFSQQLTHVSGNPGLYSSFVRMHRDSQQAGEWTEAGLFDWLCDLEVSQIGDRPSPRTPSRNVRRARELLDDLSGGKVTLDDLAAATGTDKFHLAKLFRQEVGVAPHRYLIARRLANAQRSLAAGAPIADAAVSAGFFDQSHLNRQFTRRLGFTPAQFVRALSR
jgi:AraC-like DNA-binding protein